MELHTIRARLTAGLLNKAQRGELALMLPIGLVRDASAVVLKTPDLEVQARLDLIFSTFLQVGSAAKTLTHFNRNSLKLPRRGRFGQTCWRSPTIAAALAERQFEQCDGDGNIEGSRLATPQAVTAFFKAIGPAELKSMGVAGMYWQIGVPCC
jgi:hypothetical protein